MPETTRPTYQPNLYDLFRRDVHIQYSASSIDGRPRLHYRDRKLDKSFSGDEIRIEETALGRVVSVILQAVPDLHVVTFGFFLPTLNVEHETHVVTEAIYSTQRTSIGGPSLVKGQLESWRSITLAGIARAVEF